MDITAQEYKKILRFMEAEMDLDEMEDFEKELAANPALRHQLDFEQSLRDVLSLNHIQSLPGTKPANFTVENSSKPKIVQNIRKWFAISAVTIAIVSLLTLFWIRPGEASALSGTNNIDTSDKKNQPSDVKVTLPGKDSTSIDPALVFKKYFKKDPLPEQYPLYLAEAFTDYEAGNYKTIQQLNLQTLPRIRGTNEVYNLKNILNLACYYKGLAFLQTGDNRNALINLHRVINSDPGKQLLLKSKWYLALTYLKENNSEKTIQLLRQVVSNKENNFLVNNAEQILGVLEK